MHWSDISFIVYNLERRDIMLSFAPNDLALIFMMGGSNCLMSPGDIFLRDIIIHEQVCKGSPYEISVTCIWALPK